MESDHPELGYEFHAYPAGDSLGYAALDVFLAAAGQDQGFAPAELIVAAWGQGNGGSGGNGSNGGITKLVLTVHWPGAEEIHVAPGIVTIRSHGDGSFGGGEQHAYCFGGTLTCRRTDGRLHCRMSSPAPILNLSEEGMDWSENVVLRVVDSIESDLAACRAQFANQANEAAGSTANRGANGESSFDARLQRTDPRLLYAVGLTLAQRSFGMLPEILRTEHYWDEHAVLTRALQEAQQTDWWPSDPSLPAVLAA